MAHNLYIVAEADPSQILPSRLLPAPSSFFFNGCRRTVLILTVMYNDIAAADLQYFCRCSETRPTPYSQLCSITKT